MRIPITDLATRTKPNSASENSRARIDSPPFFSLEVNGRLYGCIFFLPESVLALTRIPTPSVPWALTLLPITPRPASPQIPPCNSHPKLSPRPLTGCWMWRRGGLLPAAGKGREDLRQNVCDVFACCFPLLI